MLCFVKVAVIKVFCLYVTKVLHVDGICISSISGMDFSIVTRYCADIIFLFNLVYCDQQEWFLLHILILVSYVFISHLKTRV